MTDTQTVSELTPAHTSSVQAAPLTPAQWADTELQHPHEDFIRQHMPAWFKDASTPLRDTLRKTMTQWHATQSEIAKTFAGIKPINQFAEPLLKAALIANGWNTVNPRAHGFKQVRLVNHAVLFIANQQTRLVDSLAKFLLPESLIPTSLEVNLISSTSHHDLLQAALQNFEGSEAVKDGFDPGTAIYAVQNGELIDLPEFEPDTFARMCRELDYVFINGYVTVNSSRILFAYVIYTIVNCQ